MKIYQINQEKLSNPLKFNYCNIEGTIIPIKISGEMKVLKIFQDDTDYIENKCYTINCLNNAKEILDERFILPEMIAVTNKTIGYIMRYVDNINFETFLKDYNISFSEKIKYLKEMCKLLEDCKSLRKSYEELSDFYIGDLHVNNLLFNTKTHQLNICDMDSCSIGKNKAYCYKYLSNSKGIDSLTDKYPRFNGKYIPNENSDIYCAIMIILDFLYNGQIEMMNRNEFYRYLNYLDSLKENGIRLFDKNLLYIFSKVFERDNNINPYEYLDSIQEKCLTRSSNLAYYNSKIKSY